MKKTLTFLILFSAFGTMAETEYILHLEDAIRVTNVTEYVVATNGFLSEHQSLGFTNDLQCALPYPTNAIPAACIYNGENYSSAMRIVQSANVTNMGAVTYGDAILSTKEDTDNKSGELSELSTMYENKFPSAKAIFDYHKLIGLPLNGDGEFELSDGEDYHTAVKRIIRELGGSIKEPLMTISFSITNNPTTVGLGPMTVAEGDVLINWGDGTTETKSGTSITATHTYSAIGDYSLSISGKVTKVAGHLVYAPLYSAVAFIYDTSYVGFPVTKVSMNMKSSLAEIGYYAFWKLPINEVDIPESVTAVNTCAFSQCTKLERVGFRGNKLKTIGEAGFSSCKNLKTIRIPESCETIGKNAFAYTSIPIFVTPENMKPFTTSELCNRAFQYCTDLETIGFNVNSPESSVGGERMFEGCSVVKQLILGPSCTYLPKWAFLNCTSLSSVTIPSALKSTGLSPFSGCTNITEVVFENDSELKAYKGMFNTCRIGHLKIPSKVTSVSVGDMPELTNLTFESDVSVKSLEVKGCPKLLNIDIPSSVETLYAFYQGDNGFTNLYYIPPSVKMLSWTFYDNQKIEDITIPSTVTMLDVTFYNCKNLSKVVFSEGSGVTNIAEAFDGCSNLTDIKLPVGLRELGEYAFYNCLTLTNVEMNASLERVGRVAFSGCISLESITFPSKLTEFGSYVMDSCQSLKTVYLMSTNPPTASYDPLGTIPSTCKIYVPSESVNLYKTASGWSTYASQIYAIEE